jgi:hypothetical protein
MLTTMPTPQQQQENAGGEIPRVELEDAKVTIRQTGRPDFTLSGISGRLDPHGDTLTITGAVTDPTWGNWIIKAEGDRKTQTGSGDISADDVHLSTERLRGLPVVPLSLWENARPEGRVRFTAHVGYDANQKISYDARVETKGAQLGIPKAEITLTDLIANIRVHDGAIDVHGPEEGKPATAKLAGGTVSVSAKWDFGQDPAVGDPLTIRVEKLAVKQLPEKWGLKNLAGNLPGKLSLEDGFLTGSAKLKLVAHANGEVETYGGGGGRIELPNFLGGQGSIGVKVGGNGQKLQFTHAPENTKAEADEPNKTLAVNVTTEQELAALIAFLAVQPKEEPKKDEATDLAATITLRDIDIAQFIEQLQLKVPYKVAGRVTVQAKFGVSLERADVSRIAAAVPELKGMKGRLGIVVRTRIGSVMNGSGTVSLTRSGLGGADVGELRIPFDFATTPGGSGRISVREATIHAGTGRGTGAVTVDWGMGAGARVTGALRFIDVPVKALNPSLGDNAFLGNGRLTGRFDLSGTHVRSIDDISGTLVARLNNTSAKEVPLLSNAVPYLNPLGVTKPFQFGDIRATLANGNFRIQRLALANPSAQIFAEGTVRTSGQLDLDVVAHTGQIGPDSRGFALLGLRLPAFGPIPLSLITEVSQFVSNRTVRLTITGNVSNPSVRVNTGALLTEEAVRFLLTRYVLPAPVSEALGIGAASSFLGKPRRRSSRSPAAEPPSSWPAASSAQAFSPFRFSRARRPMPRRKPSAGVAGSISGPTARRSSTPSPLRPRSSASS